VVAIGLAALIAFQGATQGPLPEVVTRSRIDPTRGVDFHAMVVPETVYVGQQATYQLGVFLDQETRQRIRRNPEFQPPETRSLLSYDLRESAPSINTTVDGRPYETHVFRRAVFPLTAGRYSIAQARLSYALPQTSSFFSREENFTLRSEAVAFVAIDPPEAGRPADWTGAVGVWRGEARIDTVRGRAGEPFVLTLRIEGQGNVTLLPRPRIAIDWATVVTADERVRVDSTPSLLGGWKEFDWLVTPNQAGAQRVPVLRYPFFNPRSRRYDVAESAPLNVRVAAGDVVITTPPPDAATVPEAMQLRTTMGADAPRPIGNSPIVIALLALAPLATLGTWISRRPKRPRPLPTPRQRLEALADRTDEEAVRETRRALVDGLRHRTGLVAASLTGPGAWTLALRKAGVSSASAAAVEALVEALDAACFSAEPERWARGEGWSAQAREALRLVDGEAYGESARSPRSAQTAAALAVAIGLAVAVPGSSAFAQVAARDAFALGTTAYAGGDYLRAARHFADAAHAAPRSASAWENLGTAAFLARDTANAVLGWQRALRLDPTNADLRALLSRIRAPQESGLARVPAIRGSWPILLAIVFWIVGWTMSARQCWRRRPARRIGVITAALGASLFTYGYRAEQRQEGVGLVVVADPAPLRAVPALGADARATPMVGEIAEVVERRGVWVHVRLDGARDGWIPSERVSPLGGD